MLGNIKTGKRRVYQNMMQKAEETTSDEEFEKAVKWFKSYEKELCVILKETKNYVKASSSFSVTANVLCSAFNQSLNSTADYENNESLLTLKEASNSIEAKNQILENITLPALSQYVFDEIQTKLSTLLTAVFPIIKRKIAAHNGLRKDLESYRRRVRKLQRQGKDVGDKELDKLTIKLKTTQNEYTEAHSILVSEIRQISNEKSSIIEPCFAALTVVQLKVCQEMGQAIELKDTKTQKLSTNVHNWKQTLNQKFMNTKDSMLQSAGSEKENVITPSRSVNFSIKKLKKKFVPKMGKYKSISFRGLNRSVSITNIMTDLDKSEGLHSAPQQRMDSWQTDFAQDRYSEPKEEQSQMLNRLKKEDSQESLRHSDFGSNRARRETDMSDLHIPKKHEKNVIDISEDSEDEQSVTHGYAHQGFSDDDEIESYFTRK